MHEFGVAAAVLDAVEARAAGRAVAGLRLHVGALARLDRSVFDDAFAMVADGGVAAGALVEVVEVGVEVRCRSCDATTAGPEHSTELITTCPGCGGHDLELLAGDDLLLESITLRERSDDTHEPQEVG